MEEIIEKLKQEIVNHDLVKNSSLLSSFKWKRAQYIVLSDLISDSLSKSEFMQGTRKNDLGVTISSSTLQRIFTDGNMNRKNNDLRFLKTLDKLAVFLGYPNLNNFLLHQSQGEKENFENAKTEVVDDYVSLELPIGFFTDLIINYCREEFEVIKRIPELNMDKLFDYAFKECPLIKRAKDMLIKFS